MLYKIANVKVSLKTSPIFLDTVYNNLLLKGLHCKIYNNFLVVKSKYTYIIFKTNENSENHINITKIPSIEEVNNAIEIIRELTKCFVLSQKVDNIIATTSLEKRLNLRDIVFQKQFDSIKYNNEKFPGLFIKFKKGTAIVFHSGKIVFVGSKSIEDIEWLICKICAHI